VKLSKKVWGGASWRPAKILGGAMAHPDPPLRTATVALSLLCDENFSFIVT